MGFALGGGAALTRRSGFSLAACYNWLFPLSSAMLLSIKEMEVRKIAFAETWQPEEIDFSDAGVRQTAPLKA